MNETTRSSDRAGAETAIRTTPPVREQFTVAGNRVLATIRQVIAEGNVRSIVVRHDGRIVMSFPVTVGVIGTVLAPHIVFFGTIAAVLTQCTIEVVREGALHPPTTS